MNIFHECLNIAEHCAEGATADLEGLSGKWWMCLATTRMHQNVPSLHTCKSQTKLRALSASCGRAGVESQWYGLHRYWGTSHLVPVTRTWRTCLVVELHTLPGSQPGGWFLPAPAPIHLPSKPQHFWEATSASAQDEAVHPPSITSESWTWGCGLSELLRPWWLIAKNPENQNVFWAFPWVLHKGAFFLRL